MIKTMKAQRTAQEDIISSQKKNVDDLSKAMAKKEDQAMAQRVVKIMEELKSVAENSDDLQNNHTPMEICEMMLEKVDLTKAKSILVLYNVELLFALRKAKYQGQVTFFTQSIAKKDWAEKLLPGVVVEYIDKEENPLYFMENQWPDKFDIVIANPPYNKALHLKFLDKCIDIAKDNIVFVHPASFIIETKGKHKAFNDIRSRISKFVDSVELFNGNGVFDIDLFVPCSITSLNMKGNCGRLHLKNHIYGNESIVQVENLRDISLFGYDKRFLSFRKKLEDHITKKGSLNERATILKENSKPTKNYTVGFGRVSGHRFKDIESGMSAKMHKNDFFVTIPKGCYESSLRNRSEFSYRGYEIWFEFETLEEAKNFRFFLTSNFARACLATLKFAQSLYAGELKSIPWMDFTQEWTDERLYAHFNITEEEQAFIKEVIPPYYD